MKVLRTTLAVAALTAAAALGSTTGLAQASSGGLDAVALYDSGTMLASFDTDRPEKAKSIGDIDGLTGDTFLVGIDRRVQNGKLYGVGDQGGIYTLSTRNGDATKVGQLSVALNGTAFGVDFNPAANALRIVSDAGQNLRQPFAATGDAPNGATVSDPALNYAGVTATGVTAAAYTNNDLNAATATTLFDLDTTLDQVVIQSPANAGILVATGKLGYDFGNAGLDIYSKLSKGTTTDLEAYAVSNVGGSYRLFSVDLLTGDADRAGTFELSVTDIAIDLD